MSFAISVSGSTYYLGDSGSDIDDMTAGGYLVISAITNTGSQQQWYNKGRIMRIDGSARLDVTILRATKLLNVIAPLANFSAYGAGRWVCVAARYNTAGVDADQQIFMGSLRGALSEPSAYSTQQVGSGAPNTDASNALNILNSSAGTRPVTSPTLAVAVFNAYPTMQQLLRTRDELLTRGRRPVFPSSVARAWRFERGNEQVVCLKSQNALVVTSGTPTVRQGPPRRMGGALSLAVPEFVTDVLPEAGASGRAIRFDRRRRWLAATGGA